MNIAFDEAREYFLKRIKTLEKRLYHADKRGNETEIADLRKKLRHCREAVRALGQQEIVRCKDCRYSREIEGDAKRHFVVGALHCEMCRGREEISEVSCVMPDDFCSDGEREDHG